MEAELRWCGSHEGYMSLKRRERGSVVSSFTPLSSHVSQVTERFSSHDWHQLSPPLSFVMSVGGGRENGLRSGGETERVTFPGKKVSSLEGLFESIVRSRSHMFQYATV